MITRGSLSRLFLVVILREAEDLLLFFGLRLRQRSAYEGVASAGAAVEDYEDYVGAGFEGVDDGAIAGFVVDGLTVDFNDHGAGQKVDVFCKGAWADGLDQHAAVGDLELRCHRGCDRADGDAELRLTGVNLLRRGVVVVGGLRAVEGRVGLGAVADDYVRRAGLAVAQVAEFDGGADVGARRCRPPCRRRP